jgi:hypothetical protein
MEESNEVPEMSTRWNLKAARRNAQMTFLHSISRLYGNSGSRSLKVSVMPQVMVGPVIGKVTSTTARILIEIDKTGSLTIELNAQVPALEKQPSFLHRQLTNGRRGPKSFKPGKGSHHEHKKVVQNVTANRPAIFEFKGLKPETSYTVEVKGCTTRTPSSFRTFPEVPADTLSFGVISCNKIFITDMLIAPAWDLWTHLSKSIDAGKVDFLLHLGDQVRPLTFLSHYGTTLLT